MVFLSITLLIGMVLTAQLGVTSRNMISKSSVLYSLRSQCICHTRRENKIHWRVCLTISAEPFHKSVLKYHVSITVQFSCSVMSDFATSWTTAHQASPCPSPTPGACSDSCPSSQWCHPAISSSAILFSCLQFFPASGSFQMSQFLASGGQSIGVSVSASVLPMNIQDWFPLGLTDLILQSKGLSRVFSNNTVQKHQFLSAQPSLWSNSSHTWLLEKP